MNKPNFTQRLVLSIIFLVIAGIVNAQDIIKKNNGEEIKAIIQEVGNYEITYKLFTNPDGETKILKKNLIYSIQFSNGDKEIFNRQEMTEQKQPEQYQSEQKQPEQYLPPKVEKVSLPDPDLIVLTDGDVVEGFVKEIGLETVKYKKAGNPDGPTFTLRHSSISKILYANGWEEAFTTVNKQPPVREYENPFAAAPETFREETPYYYQKEPSQEYMYETQKKFNPNKFRFYLGSGIGNSYGIIGGNLEFRFSWFAFHGGLGWYPLAPIVTPAWSAGIKFYVWRNMYLNTVVGTVGHYEEHHYSLVGYYNYYSSNYEPITGISQLFGYQWAWGNTVRFGINLGAGISVAFVDKPLIAGSIVAPAFDFGISLSFGTKKKQ